MGRKNGFQRKWGSATDIGRQFGLSSIAVNKRLTEAGWRDESTKAPTQRALADGLALSTPLKDGKPHFMWSRDKLTALLATQFAALPPEEVCLEEFLRGLLMAESEAQSTGSDKFLYLYVDECLPSIQKRPPNLKSVHQACARLGIKARAAEIEALVLGKAD